MATLLKCHSFVNEVISNRSQQLANKELHDENFSGDLKFYTENEPLLDRRLTEFVKRAKKYVPGPVVEQVQEASVGLIAYGSTDAAMGECREQLESEYGIKSSYLRMRALPMTSEVREFVSDHESVFVIEQNRDGQLADIIRLEIGEQQDKIRKILHYDGLSISARFITEHVVSKSESTERDE